MPEPPRPSVERPSALAALRVPYFGPVWVSNLLQFFGTQVQLFTLQWLVTDLTDSRTLIGLIISAQGASRAFFSPLAGVATDRLPKRNLLSLGRMGIALAVCGLIVLVSFDMLALPHLFLYAIAIGLLTAICQPATQTFVFDVVGRQRTQSAVALNSAGIGAGQLGGPALAGVLVAQVGIIGSWSIAAAALFMASSLLWLVPIRGSSESARAPALEELRAGFHYVWSHPPVRMALLVTSMSFFNGALYAMRPVFARHVLGVGSEGMGWMAACAGAGTLIGAVIATGLPHLRRPGLAMALGMLGFSLSIILYSFALSYPYILVIEFISGVAAQTWQISTFTGLQTAVPEDMRGRVIGIVFMLTQLAMIGGVFIGRLADGIGDQQAMAIFGVIPTLVIAGILLFGWRTLTALGTDPA